MYFPGDPLPALDPIYLAVPDQGTRERLVARFDIDITLPDWALGHRFDFVLRGSKATPIENSLYANPDRQLDDRSLLAYYRGSQLV
jgi:protocatechuate 3,4-dioxygenase beta subunit